ncbi:hypothetical protein KAU11_08005, partial [Candidatus Babeliales bacterium]|nr:hypothetical protein [Candidatus Babeliales bacterium]
HLTIELDQDYSGSGVDFIFKVPRLVIDTRTQNTNRISKLDLFIQIDSDQVISDGSYIANKDGVSGVELTLPEDSGVGDMITIAGKGSAGWIIKSNANASTQMIHDVSGTSTASVSGSIDLMHSTSRYDSVRLLCLENDSEWAVQYKNGTILD